MIIPKLKNNNNCTSVSLKEELLKKSFPDFTKFYFDNKNKSKNIKKEVKLIENYNTYIQNKKILYVTNSLKSSSKIQSYVNKLNIFNKKTGEVFPVKYDFMNIQKNNYLWYNFVSTYIQNNAVKDGLKAVFITLTVDTDLHKYKTLKNGKHVLNPKYENDRNAYKVLNDGFRYLYNDFRINRKKVKTQFLRVVEPHKDFTPHLHALIFLKDSQISNLQNHLNNTIKTFGLGSQFDFTVLKDTQASVSYILKYVKKSIASDSEADSRVIDGWKKEHKIRMFTHSQISIQREVYKTVSRFVDLKQDGKDYSILQNLEDRIDLKIDYFVQDGGNQFFYKNKDLFNKNSRYKVRIKKLKKNNKDLEKWLNISDRYNHWTCFDDMYSDLALLDFDYSDLHRYLYDYNLIGDLYYVSDSYDYKTFFKYMAFDDFIDLFDNYIYDTIEDIKSIYKIIGFTIYDTETNEFLYDLNDFELL